MSKKVLFWGAIALVACATARVPLKHKREEETHTGEEGRYFGNPNFMDDLESYLDSLIGDSKHGASPILHQ